MCFSSPQNAFDGLLTLLGVEIKIAENGGRELCESTGDGLSVLSGVKTASSCYTQVTWMPIVDDEDDPIPPRVVAGLVLEARVQDQGLAVFPRPLLLPYAHPAILRYIHPCTTKRKMIAQHEASACARTELDDINQIVTDCARGSLRFARVLAWLLSKTVYHCRRHSVPRPKNYMETDTTWYDTTIRLPGATAFPAPHRRLGTSWRVGVYARHLTATDAWWRYAATFRAYLVCQSHSFCASRFQQKSALCWFWAAECHEFGPADSTVQFYQSVLIASSGPNQAQNSDEGLLSLRV